MNTQDPSTPLASNETAQDQSPSPAPTAAPTLAPTAETNSAPVAEATPAPTAQATPTPVAAPNPAPTATIITLPTAVAAAAQNPQPNYAAVANVSSSTPSDNPTKMTFSIPIEITVSIPLQPNSTMAQPTNDTPAPATPTENQNAERTVIGFQSAAGRSGANDNPDEFSEFRDRKKDAEKAPSNPADQPGHVEQNQDPAAVRAAQNADSEEQRTAWAKDDPRYAGGGTHNTREEPAGNPATEE